MTLRAVLGSLVPLTYREQFHYVVTVPAGTLKSAPQNEALAMPARTVTRINWRVPAGPQGTMGFLIGMGKVALVPQPTGTYVVADGNSGTWDIAEHPDSGGWSCIAYNTGTFPHSIYLTFWAETIERKRQPRELLAAPMLAPVPDLSHAGPPVRRR